MAFKLFGKKRKRPRDVEPIEEDAVQEDEDDAIQVEPGQPVPFEASSWLPARDVNGNVGSMYQRGSADVSIPDKVILDGHLRAQGEEEVHIVRVPPVYQANQMIHECLNCGYPFKVPYGRPVNVTCPDCRATDTLM